MVYILLLKSEEVRKCFPNVHKLISNVGYLNKFFFKSPYRIGFFLNEAPELPLPPEPIITRWGTSDMAQRCYILS